MKRYNLTPVILLGWLLLLPLVGLGQPQQQPEAPSEKPVYSLTSPREAVSRHLYYLNNDNKQYNVQLSADALSGGGIEQAKREELAIKLKQLFDVKGKLINPEFIPSNAMYWDSTSRSNRYYVLKSAYPEIYLELSRDLNGAITWRYSQESVRLIDVLYQKEIPWLTRKALDVMPSFFRQKVLGMEIWKYIGFLVVAIMAYLIHLVLRMVFNFLIRRFIMPLVSRTNTVDVNLIPPVARPLSLLAVVWIVKEWMIPGLILPIAVSKPIIVVLQALIPFFGLLVAIRFVDVLADVGRKITSKTDNAFDDQAIPIIVKGAKLVVGTFGFIAILAALEVNVTALLAGVSIGGLALALAAQDTVKNFIGSVAIFFDRPFIIGDFIAAGELSGVITEVGLRSTRLRALDGAQITIPNGKIADMVITNHGVRSYRRYATTLGLTYDTPPHLVEQFVEGVREIAVNHPKSRDSSVTVQFHEMADSSLNVFFAAIYDTTDYGEWLLARQEVFVQIMKLAEQLGVGFAFPSTSVYIESMPKA